MVVGGDVIGQLVVCNVIVKGKDSVVDVESVGNVVFGKEVITLVVTDVVGLEEVVVLLVVDNAVAGEDIVLVVVLLTRSSVTNEVPFIPSPVNSPEVL